MHKSLKNLLLLLLVFVGLGSTEASIGRYLPFSGFHPIPPYTPGPINIDVKDVKNITTFPVGFLTSINVLEIGSVKNTGYSVEINLVEPVTSNALIGGVLGLNLYVFRQMIYYWADSADGVATTTVNGENGTPLEVHILYYNVKYGSFHEALKYRNGLAEVVFRISVVGSIPNPAFTPVGGTLKKIQKAGSQAEFPLLLSFLYFVLFPPISNYFVYPGAYHNITTGKRYSCVTVIVPPLNPTHFISKQQFQDTFLSLHDSNGKPFSNTVEQAPVGKRPLAQSIGLLKIPNIVGIPSKMEN